MFLPTWAGANAVDFAACGLGFESWQGFIFFSMNKIDFFSVKNQLSGFPLSAQVLSA